MLYVSAISAEQGWVYRILTFLLILSIYLPTQAQYEVYDPEPSYTGQIIAIEFYVSSPGTTDSLGPELTLTHSYSGYTIDENSTISIDAENAGFGLGTDLEITYEIDNEAHLITISLRRVNGTSVNTGGWVCTMSGIGVLLEEVHVRERADPVPSSQSSFHCFPNPFTNKLTIQQGSLELEGLLLLDQMGQVVRRLHLTAPQATWYWDLSDLPAGIYWLRSENGQKGVNQKIVKL